MKAVEIPYSQLLILMDGRNRALCDAVLDWCSRNGRDDVPYYYQTSAPICRAVMKELGSHDAWIRGTYPNLDHSPFGKYRPTKDHKFDRLQFVIDCVAAEKTLVFCPLPAE